MTFRLPPEKPCAPNSASAASITAARRIGSTRAHVTVGIGSSQGSMTTGHITVSDVTVKARFSPARLSVLHREEVVLAFDASELLLSARREMDPRTGGKVAHRLRHEDLARARQREDASGDVNRDACQIRALNLTVAGVESAAYLEMEALDAIADG